MTHICVSKLTIIGSDNGLLPGRRQAIIRTNARILLIGPLGTNFNEILIEIHKFPFKKIHFKMLSGKWRPYCLDLNALIEKSYLNDFLVVSWVMSVKNQQQEKVYIVAQWCMIISVIPHTVGHSFCSQNKSNHISCRDKWSVRWNPANTITIKISSYCGIVAYASTCDLIFSSLNTDLKWPTWNEKYLVVLKCKTMLGGWSQ